MKTKIIRIFLFIFFCGLPIWLFRFELIFNFQIARLRNMNCKTDGMSTCLEKFWVHRVNSLERFRIVSKKLNGIEADIAFDSIAGSFWVYHPPLTETKKLPLDLYLKEVVVSGEKHCWLDTRFVSGTNVTAACASLKAIDSIYHIKDRVIFELYDVLAANYLAEQGYKISMSISPAILNDMVAMARLKNNLSAKILYVSQESSYIKQLEQLFPDKKILTWAISFKNYFNRAPLMQLAADSRVAVILVNVKSRYFK